MTPQTPSFRSSRVQALDHRMSDERLARLAARRAFVEMKQVFMRAAADVEGSLGDTLQRQVRAANDAMTLQRLRHALIASLPSQHRRTSLHRLELHRQVDSVFPTDNKDTTVVPL